MRLPTWQTLKTIGSSYFASWTMVVPFLGYLILLGSISGTTYSIDLSSLNVGDVEVDSTPGFLRLKLTYLGLSIIGFGTIGFRILCPDVVAKYQDRDDYITKAAQTTFPGEVVRKQASLMARFSFENMVDSLEDARNAKILTQTMGSPARNRDPDGPPKLMRSDWLEKNLNSLNSIHSAEFQKADHSMPMMRIVLLVLFTVGFVVTLIPSTLIFFDVLASVISSL